MNTITILLMLLAFIIGVTTGHGSLKSQLRRHGYEVEILKSKASKRMFYRVQMIRLEPIESVNDKYWNVSNYSDCSSVSDGDTFYQKLKEAEKGNNA